MMFDNKGAMLETVSGPVHQPKSANGENSPAAGPKEDLSALAAQGQLVRKVQKARSRRTEFLASSLFGEPAWDMLLELFASAAEQKRITVGDLCNASKVPQTTALRWIDVLLKEGLVTRRPDPLDSRRIHVEMTASACSAMRHYAEQLSWTVLAG
jgi:DNA-binding MarR family transcriptional regulator